jgi:hypothetical protein
MAETSNRNTCARPAIVQQERLAYNLSIPGPPDRLRIKYLRPTAIMTLTATAKRRRREAKLDKRFRARIHEKSPLGVKNTFLGNTSKKK